MLKIKYVATELLQPYENNSKTHPQSQIDQIKKSIKEIGFVEPVLIDENNTILSGHARVQALTELNEPKAAAISLAGLTDSQKAKAVILFNKIQENGNWKKDTVIQELEMIMQDDPDFNPVDIGFSSEEFDILMGNSDDFDFSDDTYTEQSDSQEYQNAIIQYVVIFDDEEQQRAWHQHLSYLKEKYPDLPTHSSRIIRFINETA